LKLPLLRRLLTLFAVISALVTGLVVAGVPASAATPKVPHSLSSSIEGYASYVGQTSCDPHIKKGTALLAALLTKTYAHTTWSATYACGTDGAQSEHYEGRAIDWMVSARNAATKADARAFYTWLLAKDKYGNPAAMARRLGVMYIIFNNRMWGAWDGRWEQYNGCLSKKLAAHSHDNACHRTHMHISLSWNGARAKTTFWTGHQSRTDYGPCLKKGHKYAPTWAHVNVTGCPGQYH
jgi:hypothetical protein